MATFDPIENFSYGTVSVAPSPATSGTTLTLQTGEGALFANPSPTPYNIVAYPPSTGPLLSNAEILRVTGKSGDVLTVIRAQEGTTAKAIGLDWQIAQPPTKKTMQDIFTAINAAITDAPIDGAAYLRKDGAWELLTDEIGNIYGMFSDTGAIDFITPLAWDPTPFSDDDTLNIPSTVLVAYYQRTDAADINLFSPIVSGGPAGRLFRFVNQTADTFSLTCTAAVNLFFNGTAGLASSLTVAAGEAIDLQSILLSGTRRWFVISRYSAAGGGGSGTVTTLSVATANGFAGTVANPTTTPVITVKTGVTGILKGDGTGVAAAAAGDFPTLNQNTTGSAAKLTTPRNINGVAFDGSAPITVPAAGSTLTDTVPIGKGGTNATTAIGALDSLITAEANVSSATTTDLGAATTRNVNITGTVTITGFGTVAAGVMRFGRFAGILTLTHNGTSLILPGAANITTAANDRFEAVSLGSGNWLVYSYTRANGAALVATAEALTGSALPALSAAALTALNASNLGSGTVPAARMPALTGPVSTGAGAVATTLAWSEAMACSDPTTAITPGTKKGYFVAPFAGTLTEIIIVVDVAPTGSDAKFDVNKNGTTMLSTVATIEAGETSSLTAATQPVISVPTFAKGDIISVDFDQVGSTIAGAWVVATFNGTRTS